MANWRSGLLCPHRFRSMEEPRPSWISQSQHCHLQQCGGMSNRARGASRLPLVDQRQAPSEVERNWKKSSGSSNRAVRALCGEGEGGGGGDRDGSEQHVLSPWLAAHLASLKVNRREQGRPACLGCRASQRKKVRAMRREPLKPIRAARCVVNGSTQPGGRSGGRSGPKMSSSDWIQSSTVVCALDTLIHTRKLSTSG